MKKDKPAKIRDIPVFYRDAYQKIMEAVGPVLEQHQLLPFVSVGEDSIEIYFENLGRTASSPVSIYFYGPVAAGTAQASWQNGGIECLSISRIPIGENGWSLDVFNDESEEVDFSSSHPGQTSDEILPYLVSRMQDMGLFIQGGKWPLKVSERFGSIYRELSESALSINGTTSVEVSRAYGIEGYDFDDAQGRKIELLLKLDGGDDDWSLFVDGEYYGRGNWKELLDEHVKLETTHDEAGSLAAVAT
ncbi:hypothetical protein G6L37_02670 [Agrobacterium rubi]|nr:hypothetical protein [Agrobacterium rubi]NTF24300.1 hypothetical protein [Agrobacterium rubi]